MMCRFRAIFIKKKFFFLGSYASAKAFGFSVDCYEVWCSLHRLSHCRSTWFVASVVCYSCAKAFQLSSFLIYRIASRLITVPPRKGARRPPKHQRRASTNDLASEAPPRLRLKVNPAKDLTVSSSNAAEALLKLRQSNAEHLLPPPPPSPKPARVAIPPPPPPQAPPFAKSSQGLVSASRAAEIGKQAAAIVASAAALVSVVFLTDFHPLPVPPTTWRYFLSHWKQKQCSRETR